MGEDRKLDFLRVLIAAAWADGDLTCEEMNNLKAYFRELELDDAQLTELQPYLADPVGDEEASTIIDDFLTSSRGAERATVIAAVRDLLISDGDLDDREAAFMDSLENAQQEATTARVFVAQLKRLWGAAKPDRDDRFRRSELVDEFIRNRVFYQVKRRLLVADGGAQLDADTEKELRYVCALGALLGHVAGADTHFDSDERATIAEILDQISVLQPRDIDIIVEIVESEVLSDVGYFSFARELNDIADRDEKLKVLSMLWDVAAADGEISHEEHEEIRKISKALNVEHTAFIAAKPL